MILELKVKVFRLKYLDKEKLIVAECEEQIPPRYLRGALRVDVVGDAVISEVYRNFANKRIRKNLFDVERENADLAMQHSSDKNSIIALTH